MPYVLKKDKLGGFIFNLTAGNEQVVLTSESYTQKASAEAGIASVRRHGPDTKHYELKTDSKGGFFFVLLSSEGAILGNSAIYSTMSAALYGVATVQSISATMPVKDETGDL